MASRVALGPTDFELAPGELVALVGPNGAGKSTLLSLLAGALPASGGAVAIADPPATVGWAPQRPALYGHLTRAREHRSFRTARGLDDPRAASEAVLDQVDLPAAAQRASQLSAGNQQRLNLALALLGDPDVLILDEPTASLDPKQRRRLWELLLRRKAAGLTALLATHSLEEASALADRVLLLVDGVVVREGTADELAEGPDVTRLWLLLGKDLKRLGRSPLLLAALVLYPLLVALLVGLVVRYAGERPRVALVDRAGLPQAIVLGSRSFDLQQLFEDASEVDLVRMSPTRAKQELETGQVVAVLTVPEDFTVRLRGLRESPKLVLRTSSGALGSRVTEKMRALVYGVNLQLQQAFIDANLGYVKLLQQGGSGRSGARS